MELYLHCFKLIIKQYDFQIYGTKQFKMNFKESGDIKESCIRTLEELNIMDSVTFLDLVKKFSTSKSQTNKVFLGLLYEYA